jgi:hypothetical protein
MRDGPRLDNRSCVGHLPGAARAVRFTPCSHGYEPLAARQGAGMQRDEVTELHFITSIENLGSILEWGILSHDRAARINHKSVALEDVQDRTGIAQPG